MMSNFASMNNLKLELPKFKSQDYIETDIFLGHGSFGSVILVRDKKTEEAYALKKISIAYNQKNVDREIIVMSSLKNPCLCPLLSYQFENDENLLYLLLPYFKNKSIGFVINMNQQGNKIECWDTTAKMKALYGIAFGMAYMHSKNAIHRDLKPDNILLDENYEVKITDFGTSRFFNLSESLSSLNVGTPPYMAPELISGDPYDQKVDVYSYAITMYEILFEKTPYNLPSAFLIFSAVIKGNRPDMTNKSIFLRYGESLYNLIQNCWCPSPQVRPTFNDIVQLLPSILPKDTDLNIFYEYVNRINPDAAKNAKIPTIENIDIKKFSTVNIPVEKKLAQLDLKIPISTEENSQPNDHNPKDQQNKELRKASSDRSATEYNCFRHSIRMITTIQAQANMGNPKEMFNYGLILYCGNDEVHQDIPKAIKLIKKAAKKNNIDAVFWLGMHYLDGTDGIEIDMDKARRYIKQAADDGRPLAQFYYGFNCERGIQCYPPEINPEKATHEQKKKYEWTADKKEGFIYTKAAAEKGHAVSAFIIAKKYEKGIIEDENSEFSLQKNNELATKFYKMAADAGHVRSMIKFSERANFGLGMKRDCALAVKYMKYAADVNDMHALFYYGTFFLNGMNGIKQNCKLGTEYIKKAADKGLPEAMSLYAGILEGGVEGVEKNPELAQKYKLTMSPIQSSKK